MDAVAAPEATAASTEDAIERLRAEIARHDGLIVAYSGGVDSALVAWIAHDMLGDRAVAITAVSPSLAERDRRHAQVFARDWKIPHIEVHTDEVERGPYAANGPDRCYHCKSALLSALQPLARLADASIALGTNADDVRGHRPGHRAAQAEGSLAPLVDAGLNKADVRAISQLLGLRTAQRPAAACLASRIAYGDRVTPELLARIEYAEDEMHRLGFAECRVRAHGGGTVARIEVPADQIDELMSVRVAVNRQVHEAGFVFCALDLAGFTSGRMNELLPLVEVTGAPA